MKGFIFIWRIIKLSIVDTYYLDYNQIYVAYLEMSFGLYKQNIVESHTFYNIHILDIKLYENWILMYIYWLYFIQ